MPETGTADSPEHFERLAVIVCLAEALGLTGYAVTAVVTVRTDSPGGSDAVAVSLVAFGLAAGMTALGAAFWRHRRWPLGLFVTVQLLVAVIALGQVGAIAAEVRAALTPPSLVAAFVVVASLLAAALGLWAAVRLAQGRQSSPPGPGTTGRG